MVWSRSPAAADQIGREGRRVPVRRGQAATNQFYERKVICGKIAEPDEPQAPRRKRLQGGANEGAQEVHEHASEGDRSPHRQAEHVGKSERIVGSMQKTM